MNFIFISPQFPSTYWNFCDRLHRNKVNVLGIGDCPYDALDWRLKKVLTEYYKVENLGDYGSVFRGVAFFSYKYGKIDWLESNNEFWLEQDARLRTDFHITTGIGTEGIARFKSKFRMKEFYKKAGVPSARCLRVTSPEEVRHFLSEVGYPVIVKPEIGVGAADTWKLSDEAELEKFLSLPLKVPYVIEEFVEGNIYSYDAIIDSHCRPLFESMSVFPPSIMDIVLKKDDLAYYTAAETDKSLAAYGRASVAAFEVRSRFVHLEFFRLTKDKPGLGYTGDFVGLEVNMRPAGGYTPDMMDFAHNTDVYQIWADMVTQDCRVLPPTGNDHFCVYVSRRDCHEYVHSHEEILKKYGKQIVMCDRMPEILSDDMGNQMYTANAESAEEVEEFITFVQSRKNDLSADSSAGSCCTAAGNPAL